MTTTTTAWVITTVFPGDHGELAYWTGGNNWTHEEDESLLGKIRRYPSKEAAVAAVRKTYGRMPRALKAVQVDTAPTENVALEPSEPVAQEVTEEAVPAVTDEPTGLFHIITEDDSPENARAIDKQLRQQARAVDRSWAGLEAMIADAKTREIHTHLGFKSWPDYIADVARTEMPNIARSVEQRRQVVAVLAGEGMSNRAIADAVGVNEITVRRDRGEVRHDVAPEITVGDVEQATLAAQAALDQLSPGDAQWVIEAATATVTGRDGKTYPAKPKPKPEPQPKPEPTQRDKDMAVLSGLKSTLAELRLWAATLLDGAEEAQEALTRVRITGFGAIDDCHQIIADVTAAQSILAPFLEEDA
jgi:hypothetical protein